MLNFISGIALFLISLSAYAADQPGAVDTSVSESSMIGVIVFAVIFFGAIAGYFAYLYWGKKESRDGDKAQKQ